MPSPSSPEPMKLQCIVAVDGNRLFAAAMRFQGDDGDSG